MKLEKVKQLLILCIILIIILIVFVIVIYNKNNLVKNIKSATIYYYPYVEYSTGDESKVVDKVEIILDNEELKNIKRFIDKSAKFKDKSCEKSMVAEILINNNYKLKFGSYCGVLVNNKNNKSKAISISNEFYLYISRIIDKNNYKIFKDFSSNLNENISLEKDGNIVDISVPDDKKLLIDNLKYIDYKGKMTFKNLDNFYIINFGDSIKLYTYNNMLYGYYTDASGDHIVRLMLDRTLLDSIYDKYSTGNIELDLVNKDKISRKN